MIAALIASTSGLVDIREPVSILDIDPEWWFALAISLLVVFWIWLRARRSDFSFGGDPATPVIPPIDRARQRLAEARDHVLEWTDREFSGEASAILRDYLEEAFALPATTSTTREFLDRVQNHPIVSEAMREKLNVFLDTCDLSKFAKQPVDPALRRQLLDHAENVIEESHGRHQHLQQDQAATA